MKHGVRDDSTAAWHLQLHLTTSLPSPNPCGLGLRQKAFCEELGEPDPIHSLELEKLAKRLLTSIPNREERMQLMQQCGW